MKKILTLAVLITCTLCYSFSPTQAQGKELSLEDAVLKQRSTYGAANLSQLNWIPGTDKFAYIKEIDDEWVLIAGSAEKEQREILCTLTELSDALAQIGLNEKASFPNFRLYDDHSIRFSAEHNLVVFDYKEKTAKKVNAYAKEGGNADVNMQHGIAYTVDQNIFVSVPGNEDYAVTSEKNQDIRNGEAAHRYEFGIGKGTFWSPDGKRLAYYRVDETMVTSYPLLNLRKEPATYEVTKYPFAGDKSHRATVAIYNAEKQKTIFLKTSGDPEHYLTNITWHLMENQSTSPR